MMDLITHTLALAIGGTAVWLTYRPRLEQLRKLTDRDPKTGRFWKREP